MNVVPAPTIEERLCAAAFTILTDDRNHSWQAQTWAVRCLRRFTPGGRTAFNQRAARAVAQGARR